jgi:hypothetical protein
MNVERAAAVVDQDVERVAGQLAATSCAPSWLER